jgi:hypothetical protein
MEHICCNFFTGVDSKAVGEHTNLSKSMQLSLNDILNIGQDKKNIMSTP